MLHVKRKFCAPCFGGGGGGGSSSDAMMMMMMMQASMPKPPPAPNPAIQASSQMQPSQMAKNARIAAGLAGSYDNTLLTGPGGAIPATASASSSKTMTGQ